MTDEPRTDTAAGAMERSGMGLLPGMALATLIGVLIIGGVLIEQWWVVPLVFLALVLLAIVVVGIVVAVMEEEGEGRLRRYVPGL